MVIVRSGAIWPPNPDGRWARPLLAQLMRILSVVDVSTTDKKPLYFGGDKRNGVDTKKPTWKSSAFVHPSLRPPENGPSVFRIR